MNKQTVIIFKGTDESLSEGNVAKVLRKAIDVIDEDLQIIGMSRLVPGQVSYTLVSSEEAKRLQEQLHYSCRNSLAGIFDKA